MDWLQKFNSTIRQIKKTAKLTDQSERDEINTQFEKLFKTNRTNKDTEINIQSKPGHPPTKQKTRPIPYHLKLHVAKGINNFIKSRHLKKLQKLEEDCFLFPMVFTLIKDKSAETPLDSRKLNKNCIKMRPLMPNREELLNQISNKITRTPNEPLWISKIDLEYTYGQLLQEARCRTSANKSNLSLRETI